MSIDLSISPQQTAGKLIDFIKNILKQAGFSKLVLGLSGGIDSAVSLALGVKAIGAQNIFVGIFPYGELNKEGAEDAKLLVDHFNIPDSNINLINIKPLVDPLVNTDSKMDDLRRGNIMVRIRMILLYDMSKKYKALVLGTENKTEHLLGYFTRFGDEASDLEPIINLYKTQVRELASYLGVPEKIIKKAPTAGMWIGQTDEKELEFTYEKADKILFLLNDKKYFLKDVVQAGFEENIVKKVVKRVKNNSFKHKLPYKSYPSIDSSHVFSLS